MDAPPLQPMAFLDKIWVRKIRYWSGDDRQPAIISTHHHMTAEQITSCMRSRWVQENFFKYMGTHSNFDGLTGETPPGRSGLSHC